MARDARKARVGPPVRAERGEQAALFEWAALQSGAYPELRLLYHIPNGGYRNLLEAAHLKALGVKAGLPDIHLPVARGGFHGLYIELKRPKGGRTTKEQREWLDALKEQGYLAAICPGCGEAAALLLEYLKLKTPANGSGAV